MPGECVGHDMQLDSLRLARLDQPALLRFCASAEITPQQQHTDREYLLRALFGSFSPRSELPTNRFASSRSRKSRVERISTAYGCSVSDRLDFFSIIVNAATPTLIQGLFIQKLLAGGICSARSLPRASSVGLVLVHTG